MNERVWSIAVIALIWGNHRTRRETWFRPDPQNIPPWT